MQHGDTISNILEPIGLDSWLTTILAAVESRLSGNTHGDFPRWKAALDRVRDGNRDERKDALLSLAPWRKGPFRVGDVEIDAEWRSDLKWARVRDRIEPLTNRNVLDVGCGNGYYALQMRDNGATRVVGIDPTVLYVMQFLAVNTFVRDRSVCVLPMRLNELPPAAVFDTVFSMGVLYHQRSPVDHLRQLRDMLRPGGQLVLETIFIPGEESYACTPADRYARMKNVWLLPTIAELTTWLNRCNFRGIAVVDTALTTPDEQRSTEWMTFESLADALMPGDPTQTVEGWPAPSRVVVTATKPG